MTKAYLEKIIQFLTAAFGLAAGLAWNEAIQAFIERFVGPTGDGLGGKLLYAVLLTIIAVTVTVFVSKAYDRIAKKEKLAEEKRHHDRFHAEGVKKTKKKSST